MDEFGRVIVSSDDNSYCHDIWDFTPCNRRSVGIYSMITLSIDVTYQYIYCPVPESLNKWVDL
jgi:hypothetical protein